jgi:hypothetical protein
MTEQISTSARGFDTHRKKEMSVFYVFDGLFTIERGIIQEKTESKKCFFPLKLSVIHTGCG